MTASAAYQDSHWQERYQGFAEFGGESATVRLAAEVLDTKGFMRRRAEALAKERMQGEARAVQDPMIDLLGSARLLLALEEEGRSTEGARINLRNDIRTGLLEATQEKGHISEYEVPIAATGEATIGGVPFYEIFLRGIHPGRAAWANEHAAINIHEEFLNAAHFTREQLRREYGMMVVSPLPEDVGVSERELRREGYRPDSRKMMVRLHRYMPDGLHWKRVTQQLCLSGSDIKVINKVLHELGVLPENEADLTTTQVLDRPFLCKLQDFPEGVAAFARIFDAVKGGQTKRSYFCGGEATTEAPDALYKNLSVVSREREAEIDSFINELEAYAYKLVRDETLDFTQQTEAYSKKTRELVRRMCALHPEYAEHAFGKEAAEKYRKAYEKLEDGDRDGADAELADAFALSTSIVMCGVELEDGKEANATGSSRTTAASAAERQEALHCMEIKIKGYTIRPQVRCPECTPVTGQKVRARETAHDIACLNDKCGYRLGKDGTVLRPSKIHQQASAVSHTIMAPENVIPLRPVALEDGRRYKVGDTLYEFRLELGVGEARPQFATPQGELLSGEIARQLQRTIQLAMS